MLEQDAEDSEVGPAAKSGASSSSTVRLSGSSAGNGPADVRESLQQQRRRDGIDLEENEGAWRDMATQALEPKKARVDMIVNPRGR